MNQESLVWTDCHKLSHEWNWTVILN